MKGPLNVIRILWSALALVLLAFVVFEGVKYGWVAVAVILAFLALPDLTLVGAGRGRIKPSRVRLYNLAHQPLVPLAIMIAGIFAPIPPLGWGLREGLELFLACLAWLLHIAVDRAAGYGLRNADGSIRPVGVRRAAVAGHVGTGA